MRIKSLDILGFKSFADRARLQFGTGITGVVGPNGCGKSNIIDAIRWVMGEMSAKHLRGRAMQDVIFAGSDKRGPSGLAEVTLTMLNDGNVPPAYSAFSEIAVTRRLHLDGTSEYFLNKSPCRLRDITDLFLGTGVGTRAYSIIEQGRIGFIVSSRPEDRRSLIEEVAGISKFRLRKKAAERRMEATEQNLARINDIVQELERQLESLRRQARKAERYRELKEELRHLDLHRAAVRLLELLAVEQAQIRARDTLRERLRDTLNDSAQAETALETERLRHVEQEVALQTEQQASAEIDAQLAAVERDVAHWRTQRQDTDERLQRAQNDAADSRRQLQALEHEAERLRAQVEALATTGDDTAVHMAQENETLRAIEARLLAIDKKLEALQQEALEHVHELARQRAHAQACTQQQTSSQSRVERAQQDHRLVSAQLQAVTGQHDNLLRLQADARAQAETWQSEAQTIGKELAALERQIRAGAARLRSLAELLQDRRTRLQSLVEITDELEGLPDGVRALLAASFPGALGLLTTMVRVDAAHERAIEAALGERLQYLVVEDPEVAERAIAHLKDNEAGRGGFLPVAIGPHLNAREVIAGPGVVGPALAFVQSDAAYAPLLGILLHGVTLVNTLATARALQLAHPTTTFATLGGDVLQPGGIAIGGDESAGGLLARQREIRELRDLVGRVEREHAERVNAHTQLEQQLSERTGRAQELQQNLRQFEREELTRDKDFERLSADVERLKERLEVVRFEREQFENESREAAAQAADALQNAESAAQRQRTVDESLAVLRNERSQERETRDARAHQLTELKVTTAARDERLAQARLGLERNERGQAACVERSARADHDVENGQHLLATLATQLDEGTIRVAALVTEAQERRAALQEARGRYDEERSALVKLENALKDQRRDKDDVQESLNKVNLDLQRVELERKTLFEQVAERYDLNLAFVVSDYHTLPLPGADDDVRRDDLERRIKGMGPINLTAINECAEVEQRYGFLCGQRNDLTEALDALRKAVQRINRTSRQRFREAFDAVNKMFQEVFPRLFRGGEARLELLPHEDILEAGVDIIAQPPGKKLQSVGLLSGGEKALTATALVFAIFLIKPSPFCVLDEVDAPLDDANVGRFNDLLKEISKVSQFIVITHNKLTMTVADRLYGITMEDPGLSKLVRVDLTEVQEAA